MHVNSFSVKNTLQFREMLLVQIFYYSNKTSNIGAWTEKYVTLPACLLHSKLFKVFKTTWIKLRK